MALLFLVLGVLFLIVAIKGNQNDMFKLIEQDVLGAGHFLVLGAAIMLIAFMAGILRMPGTGKALIALVIVAYILGQKGLGSQLQSAITSAQAPEVTPVINVGAQTDAKASSSSAGGQGSSGGGGGGGGGGITGALGGLKGMIGG
jgi:uncharacterized membrane protein YgcG